MISDFSFQHYRFHLEPKGALQMPAYNKGNGIRGGFGRMRESSGLTQEPNADKVVMLLL